MERSLNTRGVELLLHRNIRYSGTAQDNIRLVGIVQGNLWLVEISQFDLVQTDGDEIWYCVSSYRIESENN